MGRRADKRMSHHEEMNVDDDLDQLICAVLTSPGMCDVIVSFG